MTLLTWGRDGGIQFPWEGIMSDDIKVDKAKFDALLVAMLSTPPLPKSEVKVKNPKPKK